MQKEIYKEDYFGNLMSILIDQARSLLPTFMPTEGLHKVQNDMCKAGSWLDNVPLGVIIQTVPQDEIVKFNITNFTTKSIIEFYNTAPFPYYKKDDNKLALYKIYQAKHKISNNDFESARNDLEEALSLNKEEALTYYFLATIF